MIYSAYIYCILLYKIEWLTIDFSTINKIDNLTCVIIHDNVICVDYHEIHYSFSVLPIQKLIPDNLGQSDEL